MEFVTFIAIRLLAPLLILIWPLPGLLVSIMADGFDYGAFCANIGAHDYQYLDKFLDTFLLIIIAIASIKWRDALARKVLFGLLLYRLLGVVLFFITGNEYLLFFFPNLVIDFFLFYLLFNLATKKQKLIRNSLDIILIITVIIVPKLFSEFYLHVYNLIPLNLPSALEKFYACPSTIQYPIYLIIPLGYLGYRIYNAKREDKKYLK